MSDTDGPNLSLVSDTEPEDTTAESEPVTLVLEPLRLTLSPTKLVLTWRFSLANNTGGHIVSLRIWSDMWTAKRSAILHSEAGMPRMDKARLHTAPMFPPGSTLDMSGEWHVARTDVHKLGTSSAPKALPLARFRLIGAGIKPTYFNFAVGSAQGKIGRLPAPLFLDDDAQIFPELVATRLPE